MLGKLCNLSESEFPHLENMVVMKIQKENACKVLGYMPSTEQVLDKVTGDYTYTYISMKERELCQDQCACLLYSPRHFQLNIKPKT